MREGCKRVRMMTKKKEINVDIFLDTAILNSPFPISKKYWGIFSTQYLLQHYQFLKIDTVFFFAPDYAFKILSLLFKF